MAELAVAEGVLVVAVEDADEPFEEERERCHPGELGSPFHQPLLAQEPGQHIGGIDEGPVVRVELVQQPEAVAHLSHLELRIEGQGEQRQVGLGQPEGELARLVRLLAGLDDHLAAGKGIDLAEEAQLDFSRKEAIFPAREGPRVGLVHVALGEVGDEIAGDAHVEEELARPRRS